MMCRKMKNNTVKTNRIYLLALILSLASYVGAQTNSPYSRYGMGNFQQKGSIRTRTMGGAGIAMQNKTDVNNINPSALVAMDSMAVIFDMGFHFNGSSFSSGSTRETVYSGNIDYVTLMIPMHPRWFFAASLQPVSSVGYNINTVAKYNGSYPGTYYGVNYNGKGGVSMASATNSFKLPWGISLGAELGILWGNHNETITETYSEMDVTSSTRQRILYHRGFWMSAGAQYKLSLDKSHFIFGATYDVPTRINSYLESSTVARSIIEEKTSGTVEHSFPVGYGFGVSYNYDNKLTLSTDVKMKNWARSGFGIDPQRLRDNTIISLGAELQPDYNSNKYRERISYRAGAHYESGSYSVASDAVQSAYVSFGVGLPGRLNSTLISVGLEFGSIGGFNSKHITETYGQVNIGLNLGEVWFVKPKFW